MPFFTEEETALLRKLNRFVYRLRDSHSLRYRLLFYQRLFCNQPLSFTPCIEKNAYSAFRTLSCFKKNIEVLINITILS